ncbi:MAG TPA: hypothetical protein VHT34_12775, partial [Clostridia bacterium]|nr:hypothetical protein [Clostridia bacterium]
MATFECVRCHHLFDRVGFEEVCPACFPEEEHEFSKIKEYLTVHPGASSNEVMYALNVNLKAIRRYLKEDRLEIVGNNKGFIRCEICGRPLNSGRFCDGCYKEGHASNLPEPRASFCFWVMVRISSTSVSFFKLISCIR